jgi:hypothetical protein
MAQELPQQDPENERGLGLWFDQATSAGLSENKSLEFEFHQRLDEGASNLFEYFFQGGMAFRLRPWLMLLPIYRYQRYPGDTATSHENRLLLNLTLSTTRGRWRPILRTLTEGRFPQKSRCLGTRAIPAGNRVYLAAAPDTPAGGGREQ